MREQATIRVGVDEEGSTDRGVALQLEDVVDCLNVLRPQFDYLFLFDHSQGHARKKNGLSMQTKCRRILEDPNQ